MALVLNDYPLGMTKPAKRPQTAKTPREYPNRIRELNKERGWDYDLLAEKVGSHPKTIGALARGDAEMTLTWMKRLARAFNVNATEIIERPASAHLRSVLISGTVQAGAWADNHTFEPQDRTSIAVHNDPELRGLDLYALKIEGESMNKFYPAGSIVVLTRLAQRPGEIQIGKRYHVVRTRGDLIEETIKTLVRASNGEYWLQPESDSPEFAAFTLQGEEGTTVELRGRVRYALTVE
jgi:transcriptional regulator with XRE-family HTH domain